MIEILKVLEPRLFLAKETINNELDEVNEILFIEKGEYNIFVANVTCKSCDMHLV